MLYNCARHFFYWPKTLCFLAVSLCCLSIDAESLRVPSDQNDRHTFPITLLKAALERGGQYQITYPYGDIEALPISTRIAGVQNKDLDLFVALSTPEYEQEFLPVYIPIYRGLMGMRLAIVKESKKSMFNNVRNIEELKQYMAGQGTFWADSKILESNGIPLVKTLKYENLFRMLEADRFDYFPRGLHEPWNEIKKREKLNLTVDENIMLWYQVPFYYFVHRSRADLAEHIQQQLEDMIVDGSFHDLFWQDEDVKNALAHAKLAKRRLIMLKNPYLTPKTPINRPELWFDLDELKQRTTLR